MYNNNIAAELSRINISWVWCSSSNNIYFLFLSPMSACSISMYMFHCTCTTGMCAHRASSFYVLCNCHVLIRGHLLLVHSLLYCMLLACLLVSGIEHRTIVELLSSHVQRRGEHCALLLLNDGLPFAGQAGSSGSTYNCCVVRISKATRSLTNR